ncbi:GTP-binding protein YchF [Ancylostoma duodenale]|uniref:GTP-binding protein YchF n=1 Tax=Ancylostoma duodenale TaxID=51022 RepID=A0A0C2G8D5_9BILA|nr:GTP-binding protein YchF [Ancylostoma duodenale]
MPPKKKGEVERVPLLGRLGTNLRIGILGLPNVGKSTFFNVLTKSEAQAENFPFCTIDPNESRVPVSDSRFDWLCEHYHPVSKVPAYLNVTDIAGLVKGAAEGQGLGNAFLSHVSACEALFHLVRAFEDDDVTHVEGEVNPCRDLEIISDELFAKDQQALAGVLDKVEKQVTRAGDKTLKVQQDLLKLSLKNQTKYKSEVNPCRDLEIISDELFAKDQQALAGVLDKVEKQVTRAGDKTLKVDYDTLLRVKKDLDEKKPIRLDTWNEKEIEKNKWLPKIKEWIDKNDPGAALIPFSGVFENKLMDMPEDEREKFCKENQTSSNLDKIVHTGYKALQLEYFFTAGKDEVKAWTIQKGTLAPKAAGRIHTDFEKGFIMAEVMKVADLMELGEENKVRDLWRL